MNELDIGEVARRSGLAASTLRFYEEKGLIAPTGRRGLKRVYPATVLERLGLIALGRAAGFSLEEIGMMLAPDVTRNRPRIDRGVLLARADEIDRTIAQLTAVRDGLRHAAACRAPSHMECPTFQRIVRAAAAGALSEERTERPRRAPPPPAAGPSRTRT